MYKDDSKFCADMQKCIDDPDTEKAHVVADNILCEALEMLGYYKLVELYNQVDKWYA